MNLLRYIARETPPDKWRYTHPATGHRIEEMDKATWLAAIERFHVDNGFALEPDWKERAEHELCMTLEPGFCEWSDGSKPTRHAIKVRNTAEVVISGTRVFASWIAEGRPRVAPEVAEERAKTCAACYAAVPMGWCGGCVGMIGLIMDVIGDGTTTADQQLKNKSCAWCGCSALSNVWMPLSASNTGVTADMLQPDASPSHCWKSEGLRNLRAGLPTDETPAT